MRLISVLTALIAAAAAKDSRTFAVLRFRGNGPVMESRVDPIVNPGTKSGHVHTFQGGSGIGPDATGETMMASNCSSALIGGDNSGYWVPKLYFHDKEKNTVESVDIFYMNVYYFFEPTDDKIEAFPANLHIVAGDASKKDAPEMASIQLDPAKGIQPVQWTCPTLQGGQAFLPGQQDPDNPQAGSGFPRINCDGYASPMRQDIHFPSCYDPSKDVTDYKHNMVYPNVKDGKQNCPEGFIHTPHLFYEMYWNTPVFKDRWTPGVGPQPFCLANGDCQGFSSHADFLNAWEPNVLQTIIDTCNAGDEGMDKCPQLLKGLNPRNEECHAQNSFPDEKIDGVLSQLPGTNPLYFAGDNGTGSGTGSGSSSPSSTASPSASVTMSAGAGVGVGAGVGAGAGTGAGSSSSMSNSATATMENPMPAPTTTTTISKQASKPSSRPSSSSTSSNAGATQSSTPPPPPTTGNSGNGSGNSSAHADVAGWKYVGCFRDNMDRVLKDVKLPGLGPMTIDKCIAKCQQTGHQIGGLEFGSQCFCGDSMVKVESLGDNQCMKACEGNSAQICGGEDWAMSVFSATGSLNGAAGASGNVKLPSTSKPGCGGSKAMRKRHLSLHARRS